MSPSGCKSLERPNIPTNARPIGCAKDHMHIQNIKSADHPRRRLSLRFPEPRPRQQPQPSQPLPRKELQRIVAEMIG